MLADAQAGGSPAVWGAWWWILAPGIGIFLSVFSFMRLGIVMEEIMNPRMKQSSGVYKIFKNINSAYIEDVFNSMDEYEQLGVTTTKQGGKPYGTGLEA